MDNLTLTTSQTNDQCAACYSQVTNDDVYCNNCGYPLKASDFEQKTFIANKEIAEADLADHNKRVKKAGYSLYWIAGSFFLFGIIMYLMDDTGESTIILLSNIILAIIFTGLGILSKTRPVAAFITGLSLYGLIIILNVIVEPTTIIQGIIIKIVIIGFLIKGLRSAMEAEKLQTQ